MRYIAINASDWTPRDAYFYHYSFNCSRLVDVIRMLFTTQLGCTRMASQANRMASQVILYYLVGGSSYNPLTE